MENFTDIWGEIRRLDKENVDKIVPVLEEHLNGDSNINCGCYDTGVRGMNGKVWSYNEKEKALYVNSYNGNNQDLFKVLDAICNLTFTNEYISSSYICERLTEHYVTEEYLIYSAGDLAFFKRTEDLKNNLTR